MPDSMPGFELYKAKIFVGPATIRGGLPVYRLTVPSGEASFESGREYKIGDRTYTVSSIRGFGQETGLVVRAVEVLLAGPGGSTERLYAAIGESFYDVAKMSPVFAEFYKFLATMEPLEVSDIKYVRKEVSDEWDANVFHEVRSNIRNSMQLLFDAFKFPGAEEATLFVSSWFAPGGAKCILVGIPGSGKSTLIETSTLIFMSEEDRFKAALHYYDNNNPEQFEKFRVDHNTEHGRYAVGGVPVVKFGPADYLNMYKKNWAVCPRCYSPSSEYVGTSADGHLTYLRCVYERCKGRFEPMQDRVVDEIGDKIEGEEMLPGNDESPDDYRSETQSFTSKTGAEKYMEVRKKRFLTDHCPSCGEATDSSQKECASCKATLPWPVFRVIPSRGGYVPVRYDYNKGFVFAVREYTPLFAAVKMSPDKHPDEVFYYTEITKIISPTREIFEMPPKARPIVYANVKMFNEVSRSNASVQDAILGLLEEGEIESKGFSFFTKRPFVAFFDLNPHKAEAGEAGMAIGKLDWAFVDRCDFSLTMPTTSFPNKLDILREGQAGDTRGIVFEALMQQRVRPLFKNQMDDVRSLVREVEVDDEASFVLALVSDLYSRCYIRYKDDNPELEERKKIMATHPDPFLDISTAQYLGPYLSSGAFHDHGQAAKTSSNLNQGANALGQNVKRFMDTGESGKKMIDRPLSFRVCVSTINVAKARAWLLDVTSSVRNPKDNIVRPPRMEVVRRDKDYSDLERRVEPYLETKESHRQFQRYMDRLPKSETLYQLLECPECGTSLPDSFRDVTDERECPACGYKFVPLFKISLKPEDILAVFPYCAAMRFSADYNAEHIPTSVSDIFSNTLNWLKTETRDLWENEYHTYLPGFWRKFIDAYKDARLNFLVGGLSDEEKKRRLANVLAVLGSDDIADRNDDYPYYYQTLRFFVDIGQGMLDKRFNVRPRGGPTETVEETGQTLGDIEFTTKDGKRVVRERHSWDRDAL